MSVKERHGPDVAKTQENSLTWTGLSKQHRRPRNSPKEWEKHREVILREWNRNTDLTKAAHVAQYMKKHHNFVAQPYDYNNHVVKWRKEETSLPKSKADDPKPKPQQKKLDLSAPSTQSDAQSFDGNRTVDPSTPEDDPVSLEVVSDATELTTATILDATSDEGASGSTTATHSSSAPVIYLEESPLEYQTDSDARNKRGLSPASGEAPHVQKKPRTSDASSFDDPKLSESSYERWSSRKRLLLHKALVLLYNSHSVDWHVDDQIVSFTWSEFAELRRSAEVFCACAMFDTAFEIHYILWQKLSQAQSCDWGDLAHLRYKQLIYCARSAQNVQERALARNLLETYISSASPDNGRSTQILVLRACLAELLSQQNEENKSTEEWKLVIRALSRHQKGTEVLGLAAKADLDIFVYSQLLHANTLQKIYGAANIFEDTSMRCNSPWSSNRDLKELDALTRINSLFYAFYGWCSKKAAKAQWESFSFLDLRSDRIRSIGPPTVQFINTLHLFRFFFCDDGLAAFGDLLTKPHIEHPDETMVGWAQILRRQIGVSLADIIWTVASTIISQSEAARLCIMKVELHAEVLRIIDRLKRKSTTQVSTLLRENFLNQGATHRKLEREILEDEAVRLFSDLMSSLSASQQLSSEDSLLCEGDKDNEEESRSVISDPFGKTLASSNGSSSLLRMRNTAKRLQTQPRESWSSYDLPSLEIKRGAQNSDEVEDMLAMCPTADITSACLPVAHGDGEAESARLVDKSPAIETLQVQVRDLTIKGEQPIDCNDNNVT